MKLLRTPQKKGKTKKRALWCVPIIRFHVGYMQFMMPNEDMHKIKTNLCKCLLIVPASGMYLASFFFFEQMYLAFNQC